MSAETSSSQRPGGRASTSLRPVNIETGVMKFAEGSAMIDMGDTRVLVSATIENRVPPFLIDSGRGWVTAEYAMLPRATNTRNRREATRGKQGGRTLEIQRLIGRSLRAAVDLEALGERTITLDCDVLQADGGTRTASITGAWVALVEALAKAYMTGDINRWPLASQVAAISAGYLEGVALLDLEYVEDSAADVDMNIVATTGGDLIEVQGTGEGRSFRRDELDVMLDLAFQGIADLGEVQRQAVAGTLKEIESLRQKSRRRTPPKNERDLWGAPSA